MGKKKIYNKNDLLIEIKKFVKEKGYSPTIRELCILTGIKSTSTVFNYLNELEEEDLLEKLNSSARTILVKESFIEELTSLCQKHNKDFKSTPNELIINV